MAARFDRVLGALRAVIATGTALDPAWEELKKGGVGAYADAAVSLGQARRAFAEETPTMDALVIHLKDIRYKDPSWPADGADDAQMLRTVWHSIHDTIGAGKSFAPDDLSVMRNLYAALERARESLLPSAAVLGQKPYLGIHVDEEHRELKRDGFPHVTASFGPSEWHIVKAAFSAGDRGATKEEWRNGYPGELVGDGPRQRKSAIRDKLRPMNLTLESGEGARIVEST